MWDTTNLSGTRKACETNAQMLLSSLGMCHAVASAGNGAASTAAMTKMAMMAMMRFFMLIEVGMLVDGRRKCD